MKPLFFNMDLMSQTLWELNLYGNIVLWLLRASVRGWTGQRCLGKEQSPFSTVFGVADKWSGTAVSNLDDMFKPSLFGCMDVLQSRVVSEHADAAPSVVTTTPVVSINLRKVRREMPDEDLRRVALPTSETSYYKTRWLRSWVQVFTTCCRQVAVMRLHFSRLQTASG